MAEKGINDLEAILEKDLKAFRTPKEESMLSIDEQNKQKKYQVGFAAIRPIQEEASKIAELKKETFLACKGAEEQRMAYIKGGY